MDSPFDVLDVSPDADDTEIKRAYRRRVKEAHPDHGGSRDEFARVRAAYEATKTDYPERAFRAAVGVADADGPATNGDASASAESETAASEPSESSGAGDGAGGPRTNGSAEAASGSTSADPDTAESEAEGTRVEYLNYDVVADEGWEIDDDDLFEKAADGGYDPEDYGKFYCEPDESLLEAAENRGFSWPFACRGGACANCAVALFDGELKMPSNHVLSAQMLDAGIRLSCIGVPASDELQIIYNVKHLPGLDDLRLPPQQFGGAADD
ncbi:ferredoxin Fer [Halobium salinum]|uniref:Ferredoxin Fer n=1 Tax=Halobium salinum TaxID=1364940 RepID=A0ABD5PD40_9EURY|nr:ferredoxin Fer [Halobium salinum]